MGSSSLWSALDHATTVAAKDLLKPKRPMGAQAATVVAAPLSPPPLLAGAVASAAAASLCLTISSSLRCSDILAHFLAEIVGGLKELLCLRVPETSISYQRVVVFSPRV